MQEIESHKQYGNKLKDKCILIQWRIQKNDNKNKTNLKDVSKTSHV